MAVVLEIAFFIRRRDEPAGRLGVRSNPLGPSVIATLACCSVHFQLQRLTLRRFSGGLDERSPNSAAPVFQAARGYEAYRINTPAQVVSGALSGVGGAIRVRTICMGWPQLGQRNGARGLTTGGERCGDDLQHPLQQRDQPRP